MHQQPPYTPLLRSTNSAKASHVDASSCLMVSGMLDLSKPRSYSCADHKCAPSSEFRQVVAKRIAALPQGPVGARAAEGVTVASELLSPLFAVGPNDCGSPFDC